MTHLARMRRLAGCLSVLWAAVAVAPSTGEGAEAWEVEMVKDLNLMAGVIGSTSDITCTDPSFPHGFHDAGHAVFFLATERDHAQRVDTPQLWKTDGTEAGTILLHEFGSDPQLLQPMNLMSVQGTLFLSVDDGIHGFELWKSDGTPDGTGLVKDINPGPGHSQDNSGLSVLAELNGTLLLSAGEDTHGYELWRSDGTEAGTALVKDINPGPAHGAVSRLTKSGGTLFFVADDGVHGFELWKTDGTEAGTVLVKDIVPGPTSSFPDYLTDVDGSLFFVVNAGKPERQLWRSDGTEAGTALVRGGFLGDVTELTKVSGTLFFSAPDESFALGLWKSDGSAAGTSLLGSFADLGPQYLTRAGRTLFFRGFDETHGTELWKSDGTVAGTVMVEDIYMGVLGSDPRALVAVDDTLFFTAVDPMDPRDPHERVRLYMIEENRRRARVPDPEPVIIPERLERGVAFRGMLLLSAADCSNGIRNPANFELWKAAPRPPR